MAVDSPHRYGLAQLGHLPPYQANPPQFANPWSGPHHAAENPLYVSPPPRASMAPYSSIPVSAGPSAGSSLLPDVYDQQELLNVPQDLLTMNRLHASTASYVEPSYSTASPISATYAASSAPFDTLSYAPAPVRAAFAVEPASGHRRRFSQGGLDADALEASQGMLSMSQETPRGPYAPSRGGRGSADSYNFPSTPSQSGSLRYYGSVDSAMSDYSTPGSDIDSASSQGRSMVVAQAPPAPQSMMGQFSSKVSSSTQKKHQCKVCEKRFTRPSSLQTHMYSHTGEKPFACEVEGCGRHFSVVSNLRRHRKVHKSDARSEAGSEDHISD